MSAEIVLAAALQTYLYYFVSPETLVLNDKFVFGFFGTNNAAILVLSLGLAFFFTLQFRLKNWLMIISAILINAGILSNLFDRLFRAGAADYISIGRWPTFNLADVFIVVGVVVMASGFITAKNG